MKRRIYLASSWRNTIHSEALRRLFLKATNIRAERLQDISAEDVVAEGIQTAYGSLAGAINRDSYCALWNRLNAKRDGGIYAWDKNPWVWVYEFERYFPEVGS